MNNNVVIATYFLTVRHGNISRSSYETIPYFIYKTLEKISHSVKYKNSEAVRNVIMYTDKDIFNQNMKYFFLHLIDFKKSITLDEVLNLINILVEVLKYSTITKYEDLDLGEISNIILIKKIKKGT